MFVILLPQKSETSHHCVAASTVLWLRFPPWYFWRVCYASRYEFDIHVSCVNMKLDGASEFIHIVYYYR